MLIADRQARRGLTPPWANGKNAKGVPRDDGPQADRRASSAWASRSRIAGRTRCRARPRSASGWPTAIANGLRPWFTKFAGRAARRALAEAGRGDLPLASRAARTYLRNEAPAGARRPGLLAADGLVLRRDRATAHRGPRARLVSGARSRRAFRSRWCTTGCSTRSTSRQFKTLILPNIAALSDAAVRAAARVRRARRRPRGDVRDRRSTTSGA